MRTSLLCLYLYVAAGVLACRTEVATQAPVAVPAPAAARPVNANEARADSMLALMTLEEKVGQMLQLNISMINTTGKDQDITLNEQKAQQLISTYHVGSFLNGNAAPPATWYTFSRRLQEVALDNSRLRIPIIYGIDHIHGASYVSGATIFPQNINLAATFNPQYAADMARLTVQESAGLGHHWVFAPVLDLGVNAYWPRLWETFGEDPLVAASMGEAFVRTLQDSTLTQSYQVAACAKHFIGYSDPRSGWDRTPVHVPDQYLHEFFRPPFQAAFDAGIKTLMINSGEVNGVPVHASTRILQNLMRQEMGFTGVAVTDWGDIIKLVKSHRVAENEKEATYLAVTAGIDMAMTATSTDFVDHLLALVSEGRISESRIDESVRRILALKFDLSLFETPYAEPTELQEIGTAANRQLALQAARESLVLLKNDTMSTQPLLPLSRNARILLAGPSATSKRNLAGGWTIEWQGAAEERYPESMLTLRGAMEQTFSNLTYADSTADLTALAQTADAIVLAVGEEPYTEFEGNIQDLRLPTAQLDLIAQAARTGKPVILVLIEGRTRIFSSVEPQVAAVLWAGLPGFEGTQAIAEVLSGQVNPSGKLPISYPRYPGHINAYHHKPTDASTALYPFGHGLSYTRFEYTNLSLSDTVITQSAIEAQVTLSNTGSRSGQETVLWFLTDEVGRVTRPVKLLKHFEKITLQAGEERSLCFSIQPKHLSYPNENGGPQREAGYYTLQVGGLKKRFYYQP